MTSIYIYIYIKPKLLKLPQFFTSIQYLKNKIKNNCTRKPSTIFKKKKIKHSYARKPKTKNASRISFSSVSTPIWDNLFPATVSDQILDSKSLLIWRYFLFFLFSKFFFLTFFLWVFRLDLKKNSATFCYKMHKSKQYSVL